MREYNANNLIIHPGGASDPNVVVEVSPEHAGWEFIHFQVRRLQSQQTWVSATGEYELALIILSGTLNIETNVGNWQGIGERANVFAGLPSAMYLPRRTSFTLTTADACEFAAAWVATDQDHEPLVVMPSDIATEIRGGDNATRQINGILPPGFPCHRLVVVEVYTPGGNWSSYPPHKHDIHKTAADGTLLEADLEEIYYYKLDRPEGYAFQRVYTDPESPLHRAGTPIDAVLMPRENDVVLVPEGYHPVSSPPGYTTYYLNVLAGSAQSLANSEDPQYAWVKDTYQGRDARVPIYKLRA